MTSAPRVYDLLSYGWMIESESRMRAYAAAIVDAVRPGDRVLDIGSGPGIFALLAAKAGAGEVIAVDPSETVELVEQLARDNAVGEVVKVFRGVSADLVLREKAHVIVSDLRSNLPYYQGHFAAIADARQRLLAKGGRLIPERDRVFAALFESGEVYRAVETPWRSNRLGLDLSAGMRHAPNHVTVARLSGEELLTAPALVSEIDYYAVVEEPVAVDLRVTAKRGGTAHGLAFWFDSDLWGEHGFSNAPGGKETIYGQLAMPFAQPLTLFAGETLEVRFAATPVGGEYVYSWRVKAVRGGGATEVREQSTAFKSPIAKQELQGLGDDHTIAAGESAEIDALCLGRFDGRHSLKAIAKALQADYPQVFASLDQALDHVRRLAARY